MTGEPCPWETLPDGVRLSVRATPNASRDEIEGVSVLADGRAVLKVKVRAVPDKGAANAAVGALLAKRLGLAKSAVRLSSGSTARLKQFRLEAGDDAERQRLVALLADFAHPSG
ncbi:DUF167 family protein [Stappia sp.]|jgi:uncharacterized protein YggU (UPF0235/DUF167 family)|uniref:DUF167 family protein n=1 Tax=Stappia sp. TaxID=1870903 RepID=UPI003A99F18B